MLFNLFNINNQKDSISSKEEIKALNKGEDDQILPIIPLISNLPKGFTQEDPNEYIKWALGTGKTFSINAFNEKINSFELTQDISDYIDLQVRTNAIVSKAYSDLLSALDTKIEIEIEGADPDKLTQIIEEDLPKFYSNCETLRDVSRFIGGYLIRYGLFCSSKWFNKGKLEHIFVLPPFSIRWFKGLINWKPYQELKNHTQLISELGFVYAPLFPIENASGKFFMPPFLAGIRHIPAYDLFVTSLQKIARNTGFHKTLAISADSEALDTIQKTQGTRVSGGGGSTTYEAFVQTKINQLASWLNSRFGVSVIPLSWGTKVTESTTYEPPANLDALKELLLTDIVMGLKTTPSLIGWATKTNQTTLADTQKKQWKNFIETIQAKIGSVLKADAIALLSSQGYLVKKINIKFEMPSLDTEKEKEESIALQLENEAKKEAKDRADQNNELTNLENLNTLNDKLDLNLNENNK